MSVPGDKPATPHVVILTSSIVKGLHEMLQGVLQYAQEHGPWRIYQQAGLIPHASSILPNGLPDLAPVTGVPRSGWVYVGRFSPEKGLSQLLANWPMEGHPLSLIGDGPLWQSIQSENRDRPGLDFLGRLSQDQTQSAIAASVVFS